METDKIADITEKIHNSNELLEDKHALLNAVKMASSADDYELLLIAFRRSRKENYLGDIELLKAAFILECEKDINIIDNKIIEIWKKNA